jgi:predicted aspartyl protease
MRALVKSTRVTLVLSLWLGAPGTVLGQWCSPRVVLGPSDNLAIDQPYVQIALEDIDTGEIVGPNLYNSAMLDTGANGLLMTDIGYIDSNYEIARRGDETIVQYEETGVAGTQLLDVFIPYHVYFAGTDGEPLLLEEKTFYGSEDIGIGLAGVVGMPAMDGRVTILDLQAMLSDAWKIGVDFAADRPEATSHSYHVALEKLPPEYSGQMQPDDPLPTFAPLPLIDGVTMYRGSAMYAETVLIDTGAQLSIISTTAADALGIDLETDVIEYIDVGGIGGTVAAPLVAVDMLGIPTTEGVEMRLTDLEVLVLDIPGIGGVLGMETLTSGYLEPVFELIFTGYTDGNGYIGNVILDCTGPEWVLRLDLNAEYDVLEIPGDADGDGDVDDDDLAAWIANRGASGTTPATGDFDGDGDTDVNDLIAWYANEGFSAPGGQPAGAGIAPEPGALSLVLGAFVVLLKRKGAAADRSGT